MFHNPGNFKNSSRAEQLFASCLSSTVIDSTMEEIFLSPKRSKHDEGTLLLFLILLMEAVD
uniref:Uncharacterized protein n=1 Tax=Romanomermis culicivorax TaxID=13658 RepID=A0A915KDC6_ROMCU